MLQQCCATGISSQARSAAGKQLLDMVRSQRVRDLDKLPEDAYRLLFSAVQVAWHFSPDGSRGDILDAFTGIIAFPEFETAVAAGYVLQNGFLAQLCGRFQSSSSEERLFLRDTLHWVYASFPRARATLRKHINAVLCQFSRTPSLRTHVAEMLQVLRQIIRGFPERLTQVRIQANMRRRGLNHECPLFLKYRLGRGTQN